MLLLSILPYHKLCRRYLPKQMKVPFTNVPDSMKEGEFDFVCIKNDRIAIVCLNLVSISASDNQRTHGSVSGGDGVLEDYQVI